MTDGCDQCALWELRYLVAVRAAYYVALHISATVLREAVLNDVAASWAICLDASTNGAAFDQFFRQYCRDIERNVDPALRNTVHHADEYRRVWTAHALNLRAAVAA